MNTRKEIKNGIILSYLLIFLNMLYALLITPFVLKHVGDLNYGIYKSVASLSSSLAVLDLGLGSTMTRYMSKFNAENNKKEAGNFSAMILIQYVILASIIIIVGAFFFFSLESMYGKSFSVESLELAKRLFVLLIFNLILRLFENLLTGLIGGFEHFSFSNSVRVMSIFIKSMLILFLLPLTCDVMIIVFVEAIITLCAIGVLAFYIIHIIRIVPKLEYWDARLFKESLGYTVLMFLQTLTIQFNNNVDNVLIGARLGAISVTVYSMALQLFGMYESLSGSIANIMLPTISKKILQGQNSEQLQKCVEKCGRIQFVVLGAALGGFIVLGKEFFSLWLGKNYQDCYYITLILMIPVTFTMIQNVALSILRARNKMMYRTVTLLVSCVINIVITILGIRYIGYWGAAIGTATATICNLLFMNWYYHSKLQFKIVSLFMHIMKRLLTCVLCATIVTYLLHLKVNGSWWEFVLNAMVYICSYSVMLLFWGFNRSEKELLLGKILRRSS